MSNNRLTNQPPVIVRLKGDQKTMGAQLGEMLNEIGGFQEVMDFYPTMAEDFLLLGFPRKMRTQLVRTLLRPGLSFGLSRLHKQRLPQYLERTEVALAAAGLDQKMGRNIAIMDLFQNCVGLGSKFNLVPLRESVPTPIPACSSAVVWDEASAQGDLLHARNFDFPGVGVWDEAPMIVFCNPDEGIPYGFVSARGADAPGATAFNSEGLTITFHTRFHKDIGFDGISVIDLGHEIVRRAGTIDEAIAVAQEFPIASTWGAVVASGKERRAVVLETTRKGFAVVEPQAKDYLLNTNHYFHPDLQNGELSVSPTFHAYSHGRLNRMDQLVAAGRQNGGMSSADLEAMLGDMRDPSDESRERVLGSVLGQLISVMSLVFAPARQELRLSVGRAPTGWGPYLTIPMDWSRGPGFEYPDLSGADNEQSSDFLNDAERREAYESYRQASLLDFGRGDGESIHGHLARARDLCPRDPSLAFVLGAMKLELDRPEAALENFVEGLELEKVSYRRALLLQWASRSASACGKGNLGASFHQELMKMEDPFVHELQQKAQKEGAGGVSRRALRNVVTNFMTADAALA